MIEEHCLCFFETCSCASVLVLAINEQVNIKTTSQARLNLVVGNNRETEFFYSLEHLMLLNKDTKTMVNLINTCYCCSLEFRESMELLEIRKVMKISLPIYTERISNPVVKQDSLGANQYCQQQDNDMENHFQL